MGTTYQADRKSPSTPASCDHDALPQPPAAAHLTPAPPSSLHFRFTIDALGRTQKRCNLNSNHVPGTLLQSRINFLKFPVAAEKKKKCRPEFGAIYRPDRRCQKDPSFWCQLAVNKKNQCRPTVPKLRVEKNVDLAKYPFI